MNRGDTGSSESRRTVDQRLEVIVLVGAVLLLCGVGFLIPKLWRRWQWAKCAGVVVSADLAIDACTSLIESGRESPKDHAIALYKRGILYDGKGDYDRAIPDYDQAVRLDSQNAYYWNACCWSRALAGRLDEALTDCNESLRLRPGDANTLDSRALVHLKSGRVESAMSDYDDALRSNPRMATSLYGRGLAKQVKGDATGAAADIAAAKAIQADIADEFKKYGVQSRE